MDYKGIGGNNINMDLNTERDFGVEQKMEPLETTQNGNVCEEVNRLDSLLSETGSILKELEKKLTPILTEANPEISQAGEKEGYTNDCPLSSEIKVQQRKVLKMLDHIMEILHRVEL